MNIFHEGVKMSKLILVRSAESEWSNENRFTGWTDVKLSDKGVIDARNAGKIIKDHNMSVDVLYTSYLKRAIKTSFIILDMLDLMWIPVNRSWRLNERHYGALEGLKKSEVILKYGEEQVQKWRRSYDAKPPALDKDDDRYPGKDIKYKELNPVNIPKSESLKDAMNRAYPIWQQSILNDIRKGKNVLLGTHGNVIRAFIKEFDRLSDEEVVKLEIPLAIPLVYEFDENCKPVKSYYLATDKRVEEEKKKASSVL